MLEICSECQAALRTRLRVQGYEIPFDRTWSPAEMLSVVRLAPYPTSETFDAELAAYAVILHRALKQLGLDAVIREGCLLEWACKPGEAPTWSGFEWVTDAVQDVREIAWQSAP